MALGLLQPDSVERIRRFRSRPDALRTSSSSPSGRAEDRSLTYSVTLPCRLSYRAPDPAVRPQRGADCSRKTRLHRLDVARPALLCALPSQLPFTAPSLTYYPCIPAHQASPLGLDWNVSHDGRLVVGAWCAQPKDRQPGTGALGVDVMWLGLPDAFPDYETLIGSLGDLVRLAVQAKERSAG